MVVQNKMVFGTVNANRRHYLAAARALAAANENWLGGPTTRWPKAFEHREGDIKVVLLFEDEGT